MRRIQVGDIQLNVVEQGSGKPLLLIHGFPLDHSMWRAQLEGLSGACRMIAPDLRGFGASDVTEGETSMELLADDLARMLDELDVAQPVTCCGLSMGGYVAWQFWRRHRQRLDSLILCDTRAAPDTEEAARARLETAERVVAEGAQIVADAMSPRLFCQATERDRPDLVRATRQLMLGTNPTAIAAALRGMAERVDARPWLHRIDLPTLVLCGEYDAISPPEEMRQLAETIPQAEFVMIPGAGHMAPLENAPAVNAAIQKHLAGLAH